MKALKILAVTAATLSLVQASFAQQSSLKDIQKMYDRVTYLGKSLDIVKLVAEFRRTTDKSFKYKDTLKNEYDLNVFIAQMEEQYKMISKMNGLSNKVTAIKIKGKEATCTVKSTYDMYIEKPPKPRISGWSISTDVWIKTIRGWKLKKSTTVKEEVFSNGKKVKM